MIKSLSEWSAQEILVFAVFYVALLTGVGFLFQLELTILKIRIPSTTFSYWIWTAGLAGLFSIHCFAHSVVCLVSARDHNSWELPIENSRRSRLAKARALVFMLCSLGLVVLAVFATQHLSDNWSMKEGRVSIVFESDRAYQTESGESTFRALVFFLPLSYVVLRRLGANPFPRL